MLGLRFCARAFSSCGERGPLFIAVCGPLTVVAYLVAKHRLRMRRLSSCGSRAQLLRGMWDLPRPGLEPVSPAMAGGFSITAPPGEPPIIQFLSKVATKGVKEWSRILRVPGTKIAHLEQEVMYKLKLHKSMANWENSLISFNIKRETEDLYSENYKTLMKENRDSINR